MKPSGKTPRSRSDAVVAILLSTVGPSRARVLTTRTESIAARPCGMSWKIDEHPRPGARRAAERTARSGTGNDGEGRMGARSLGAILRASMRPMRVVVALPAVLLAACAARLPHPAYAPQPTDALIEVARPPPPARVEAVPARPGATAV